MDTALTSLEAIAIGMELWSVGLQDEEIAHGKADDLLLDAIRELGKQAGETEMAERIIAAWERVEKWYA
jgi:hypothetical protein